ncbi:MAG: efflux RND transporter periplasmic adaptor subunit [Pseudomonadota bacterium]
MAIALVLGLGWFKTSQIRAAIAFGESFPEPSETVYVAPARAVTWQRTTDAVGEVVATQTVEVIAEYAGAITSVGFAPADEVDAGQLLLQLDVREERAELDAAEARAELARLTLERNETLRESRAVSEQAADDARASLAEALATARRLQTVIDKKTLRAPFDATASLHDWQPGQYLQAGTTVTWLVGRDAEIWVDFALPQHLATAVSGDSVRLTPAVAETEPPIGRIVARQPFVDRASRNITFRAGFERSPELIPGAFVTVAVPVAEPVSVISVPATALRRDAFGAHVFVLHPAEAGADAPLRAERRTVEALDIGPEQAYLGSGVEAGEQVAGDGAFKLRDGLLARAADGDRGGDRDTP